MSHSCTGVTAGALTLTLTLAIALHAPAQQLPPTTAQLTREQAASDARTFVRMLESSHPDPYTNLGGKVAFKRQAAALVAGIPEGGLPVDSLAARLGMFIAPLRDAHTRVTEHSNSWRGGAAPLAVRFQTASDAIFLSASNLPQLAGLRGYRVVSVNGHPISVLLDRLGAQVPAENRFARDRAMVNALQDAALIARLATGSSPSTGGGRIAFGLESPEGLRVTRTVAAGGNHPEDPAQWREAPLRWEALDRSTDMFYYRFLEKNRAAYFRVALMGGRESAEVFYWSNIGSKEAIRRTVERYLQPRGIAVPANLEDGIRALPSVVEQGWAMLEEMKRRKTENLIIDLRGNGGGTTGIIYPVFYAMYGDAYFAKQFANASTTVVSQLYMDKYNLTVESEWAKDSTFEIGEYRFSAADDLPADSVRTNDVAAWARRRRDARLESWRRRRHSFLPKIETLNGSPLYRPRRVVVLVDPGTFSAAFQMAFYLKAMGATLVGVTPAQAPNAFMEVTPFTLPISKISGSISNSTQVFMPEQPEADVLPVDFEATYAVFRKYGFDEDATLRYALDLLSSGRI